jgi:hypothetical protein
MLHPHQVTKDINDTCHYFLIGETGYLAVSHFKHGEIELQEGRTLKEPKEKGLDAVGRKGAREQKGKRTALEFLAFWINFQTIYGHTLLLLSSMLVVIQMLSELQTTYMSAICTRFTTCT